MRKIIWKIDLFQIFQFLNSLNNHICILILLNFICGITPPQYGKIPEKYQNYFNNNRIGENYDNSVWGNRLINYQLSRSTEVDSFFIPVIMGNYNDEQGTIDSQIYWEHLFGNNPGGSFSDYYFEVSHETFYPTGNVHGWYDVDKSKSESVEDPRSFVVSVLELSDDDIDFSKYDNDGPDNVPNSGDDDGYVDGVIVIYPGKTPAISNDNGGDENNIWPHKWVLNNNYEFITNDVSENGEYIKVYNYTLCPEKLGDFIHQIGTLTHEFGHILGLPDLYDTTDGEEEPNHDFHYGIGTWGLMSYGSWLGSYGDKPSHLCAWSKLKLGWVIPIEISLGDFSLSPVENTTTIMKMIVPENLDDTKYFLFENRQKIGFDEKIRGEGLLIYHIDENQPNNRDQTHKKVDLEEADGWDDLDNQYNWGDDGDPYPGSSNNIIFSNYSYPSSKGYDIISSIYKLINISQNGSDISFSVLDADFQPGCSKGYTNINGESYCQDDLDVLQEFIDNSQEGLNPPPSDLSSIELGEQLWEGGRLINLCSSEKQDWNENSDSDCYTDYELSGEIPVSIGNLLQIRNINLRFNQLSGELPESIGNLTNLTSLYLDLNQLSDEIPESVGNLTNLTALSLSSNQLSGEIPESVGNLTNLTVLRLSGNQLSGEIPESVGNLISLTKLWLHYNQLSGEIPESIGNLINLTDVMLKSNQLTGEIPYEMVNLVNLTDLYLNNNQITGEIPWGIWNLPLLDKLFLSNNKFSGIIPTENICNITQISLTNNEFCPPYPECLLGIENITNYNGWDDLKDIEYEFCYGDESISDMLEGQTTFKLADYYGENTIYNPKVMVIEMSSSW